MNMRYFFGLALLVGLFIFEKTGAQCSPGTLNLSAIVSNVSCNEGSDGSVSLTINGGTAPFTYLWSDNSTGASLPDVTAGTYSVTVTDSAGCADTLSNIIVTHPGPFIYNVTIRNVTCFGGSDGALDFFLVGGTQPYTYVWTNVATNTVIANTEDVSGLSAGIYGLAVTDANGCTGGIFYLIAQAAQMNIQAVITDVICPGDSNGSIIVTVTGGTGTKTYLWSTGENSKDLFNKPAGTYSVTVTDVNGCTATQSFIIDEPPPLNPTAAMTQPLCAGDSSGALNLTVTGGTPPYSIQWSTGDTTTTLTGLSAGEYCVTISDAAGCESDTFCFTVTDPEEINITADITNVSCLGGSNGAIDITVTGGTPLYTYSWTGGITTEDLTGLAPGLYTVIVTDANGCTAVATFAVRIENILIVSLGVTQPLCGRSNGSATVTISGGTGPFVIQWSNGQSGPTITNLGAGGYGVQVTDANGCSASLTADVSNVNEFSVTGNVTNTVCGTTNTGAIDITVTGGTLPYTFQWSNGAVTEDIDSLNAGSYTVTVTDSTGCIDVATFVVREESGLTLTVSQTPSGCGQSNGSITVSVSGGTPPYTYLWGSGQTDSTITGLDAGIYVVTVTDANGCEETQIILLDDTGGPQISINKTDITCDNPTGTLEVVISSGTPPYTILWSTGDTTAIITGLEPGIYGVVVADSAGCLSAEFVVLTPSPGIIINAAQTEPTCNGSTDGAIDVTVTQGIPPFTFVWSNGAGTEDLTGIGAGTYTIVVTDSNGCSATTTIVVDEPDEIIVTADTLDQPLCSGDSTGSISIVVTGGTPPYSYNWLNGDTTEDLNNIPAGQYCVVITDSNGCVSDTFCFSIDEPDPLQIQPNITQPTCNGEDDGSITITVTGGTPPYTYDWSTGDTVPGISGLIAGNYSVTVIDQNSCSAVGNFTVKEPDSLIATISNSSNVTCNGEDDGTITVSVSGGTPPYDFNWSNGDSTQTITDLPPGTYDVTVTDANGCSDTSNSITITEPDSLLVTGNVVQPNCTLDGSIDVTVSGGTPPYTYSWNTGETTEDLIGITDSGTYTIIVTDSNGCTGTASFTINESPEMEVLIEVQQALTCNNDTSGILCAQVTGVPGPYSYLWSTGDTTQCISGLSAGNYSVTVTSAGGCTANDGFILNEPPPITITPIIDSVTCFGGSDGSVVVVASGGTAPYTFVWSDGSTGNSADSLVAGPITVTVTDANGCTASSSINIPQPAPFDFENSQVINNTCDTTTDGSITLVVTGGTPPYVYNWDDDTSDPVRDSLGEGTYSVLVIDANGCTGDATFTIDGPRCNEPPVAVNDTTKLFVCIDHSIGIAVLNNDYDPDGDDIVVSGIVSQPSNGTVQINSDQTITYTPSSGFLGLDSFSYVVCDVGFTPTLCDTGLVIIAVLPCRPNIDIPTGFSPDGDGTNDNFEIPGIEFFPDNVLLLFNRWGNKVREFHGYKNEWTGTNEDGEPLPDGTYYFILELHDDANTIYTGYVLIHR